MSPTERRNMNLKLEGMDKPVQSGLDTNQSEAESLPMDSLKGKLEALFSGVVSDSTGYKNISASEHSASKVSLEDGTVVTVPPSADRMKPPEEIFAAFGYNEKETSAALMRSEIDNSRDLFAEFGFDRKAFFSEVSAGPEFVDSDHLDFREAFGEYADEALYTHSRHGEKCEGTRRAGPNCMAYAYGMPREQDGSTYKHKPDPGHFAGIDTFHEISDVMEHGSPAQVKETFEKYMKMDLAAMGKELVEVESNAYEPKAGERMFALVTAPDTPGGGSDFHFYVKDKTGFWSHKPGIANPTIYDNAGNIIEDPSKCSRGFYTNFVGFYVMKDK